MTTAAIMQPTYLGWTGYYALIDQADIFILDDTAQYVTKSWHNRNRIRARDGNTIWLTIPVHAKRAPLNTITIDNTQAWQTKHWRTIQAAYSHTPGWNKAKVIGHMINAGAWHRLSALTHTLIRQTTRQLGITTPIRLASDLGTLRPDRHHRLTDMLQTVGANTLLDTPGAKTIINPAQLQEIRVEWQEYKEQPYDQDGQKWHPQLSILDLIAHHPTNSLSIIRTEAYAATCETSANRAKNTHA